MSLYSLPMDRGEQPMLVGGAASRISFDTEYEPLPNTDDEAYVKSATPFRVGETALGAGLLSDADDQPPLDAA